MPRLSSRSVNNWTISGRPTGPALTPIFYDESSVIPNALPNGPLKTGNTSLIPSAGLTNSDTTKQTSPGSENGLVTSPKEIKSVEYSEAALEDCAAIGWQLARELLAGPQESDEAVRARIEFLKEIIVEVGPRQFLAAVKQAIRISQYRNEVTIKRIRECAGLDVSPPKSSAAKTWELVTEIVTHHIERDENGNAVLSEHIVMRPEGVVLVPVPNIPESLARAVRDMGGWGALADSYPQWWAQRFNMFREVYRP